VKLTSIKQKIRQLFFMKNQRGFIQIPFLIAIIAGVLVLSGGGNWGYSKFKIYKSEQIKKEQQSYELQKALEKTQKEIETLKIKESTRTKGESVKAKSIPDIIKEWRKRIVLIVCEEIQGGSGTLMKFSDSDVVNVITNKHVIKINNERLPKYCDIKFPLEEIGTGYIGSVQGSDMTISGAYDLTTIRFKYPNEYTKQATPTQDSICKEKPAIGDSIVILGYPAIGSFEDITATEGIISGYDDEYYVTSAKVESGNSGGAAILVKNNCYLGIPTLSIRGKLESLARILDAGVALGLTTNIPVSRKSGVITVFNDSISDQSLVQSTRFIGPNDLVYRAQKTFTISSRGSNEVEILSEDAGYEYKLDCSIIKPCAFTIPGFKGTFRYDKIYGKAFSPIK